MTLRYKKCLVALQRLLTGDPTLLAVNQRRVAILKTHVGHQLLPYREKQQLSIHDISFYPVMESLHMDPYDPLDP